ncbi:MAG: Rieske 2Fe-2S domain-containing protein, partial [Planctomycetaceae bacterium]|nr:Rieske 2Fe-2S domain-containing protein [Planctomycetaceae bacterium]
LPKVAERLEKVGLNSKQTGHDNIRNVFGHPFSGLVDEDLIDTRQLCLDVDAIYINSREFSDLPRKLNICFNGTEHHPAHFWTQDLSFLAARTSDGRVGFQVLIAGTQGQNPMLAWHLPVFLTSEQVVPVTQAIIELFRAKGTREKRNKARLRFLLEEIGVGGVLDWLDEKLPFRLEPSIQPPIPTSVTEEFVGWFRQKDRNLWTMGLSVPLGRMTWQQLESLALLSKKFGDGQLRTTQEQGIAIINIPTGFKGAAATAAAAAGLSVHADEFELNTMACTGSQFCNIAVTETKGHMFQLIEKLRKRALKLHGIRIHMSGCPSSCAQHFTADIGLKGVRVRRLLGTREGFDVYLGGGLAGQVHMGLPYKLGVDVDQLPQLVEEVTNEFYLKHRLGQTFSSYWREKLQAAEAEKVGDDDYIVPTWVCENCNLQHRGEDPPVFCPGCAGLRRHFARIEEGVEPKATVTEAEFLAEVPAARSDGFQFAAKFEDIPEKSGLTVEVGGKEYALFRHEGGVKCIDSACPHEGASLADGEFKNGVVSCPWHDWTFNVCTGCSLDPPGNDVTSYEATVENGNVFIRLAPFAVAPETPTGTKLSPLEMMRAQMAVKKGPVRPVEAELTVLDIIQETPDVRTFRLDNSEGTVPFDFPGKFAKVCATVNGEDVWKSFTISSSPARASELDFTIKLNPGGEVTPYLFSELEKGGRLKIKGAQGGFYFDPDKHAEPLVLISAGSGITPMMSIVRYLGDNGIDRQVTFLYGARTQADIIFHSECLELASSKSSFQYFVTLSQPDATWEGESGRLSWEQIQKQCGEGIAESRYFLCGPNDFMDAVSKLLTENGVTTDRIHTEAFHKAKVEVAATTEGA